MMIVDGEDGGEQALRPLFALAVAGSRDEGARAIFALDQRLEYILLINSEIIVKQIRLAWWRDAFARGVPTGEPLSDQLIARPDFDGLRPHLLAMIDGWEEAVVQRDTPAGMDLTSYARGRGGGLFGAIAHLHGGAPGDADGAGMLWAGWDLTRYFPDAIAHLPRQEADMTGLPRPLTLLGRVARRDVKRGRAASPHMTWRQYMYILRLQLLRV